jgi:hypothetical protein
MGRPRAFGELEVGRHRAAVERWSVMQQTNPDISSTRRRPPRSVLLILGLGALTGPLFLFAIAVDHLGWLASKIGISGTAVTNHLRWIVVVGLFGCLGVSHVLLAILKRVSPPPPSRRAAYPTLHSAGVSEKSP